MIISGAQVRAARALLGWTTRELAHRSIVSISTVNLIEGAGSLSNASAAKLKQIQETLQQAGIEFLDNGAPGVRLHPKAPKHRT